VSLAKNRERSSLALLRHGETEERERRLNPWRARIENGERTMLAIDLTPQAIPRLG
jgi:hypothetical protein